MKYLPKALIAARALLGPCFVQAVRGGNTGWAAVIYTLGLLTDIFDGIIARRLGVATLALRLADGYVDIWFYACAGYAIFFTGLPHARLFIPLGIAIILQLASWAYCWSRFGKITSYHSLLAKVTGLAFFVSMLVLLLAESDMAFFWALWLFCINIIEEIAMTAVLPEYHHDIWNLKKALDIRKATGKTD